MATVNPRMLLVHNSEERNREEDDEDEGSSETRGEEEEDATDIYDVGEYFLPHIERLERGDAGPVSLNTDPPDSSRSCHSDRTEKILDYACSLTDDGNGYEVKYLVKWLGYDDP